jgi:hypothetical protein
MRVHNVNSNSRTSNCLCSLFKKKNQIIWIYCISRWLSVPINPNQWSSTVYEVKGNKDIEEEKNKLVNN